MSVYKTRQSKCWYIGLMHNGKRIQFSSRTKDYDEAKSIELAMKRRLGGGSREKFVAMIDAVMEDVTPKGKRHLLRRLPQTVEELLNDEKTSLAPSTFRERICTCYRFVEWCGEHAKDAAFVDDVTPEMAWSFISSMDCTASRKRNIAGSLSASWGSLIRRGLTNDNPWRYARPKKVSDEQRSGRAFTHDEMSRILEASKRWPWLETAIFIAVYTGLRRGDTFSLGWDEVDFVRGFIVKMPSKTSRFKRMVCIPLHPALREHLEGISREGDTIVNHPVSRNWPEWKECLALAGITPNGNELMTFHNLRHTFATWVRQSGADKGEQMLLGGWTTLDISNRYDHATDRLKEVVERMPRL